MKRHRTLEIRPVAAPGEMKVMRDWIRRHLGVNREGERDLDGQPPPFSFAFGGKPSAGLLRSWKASRSSRRLDNGRAEHTLSWTDAAGGLKVRCVAVEYGDFPAVEWTVWFKNTGPSDLPPLSDIQAIDAVLPGASDGKGVLHWFAGSMAAMEDFQPRIAALVPGASQHFQPVGGRPSNGTMPYFNMDFGSQGIVAAIGWPGQWAARIEGAEGGARMRSGQALTRIALRPGEEIRSPLVAFLFWKGGDWIRAQNLWRQWMIAHNLPRPEGKLPQPFTATCVDDGFPGMMSNAADVISAMDLNYREGLRFDFWWSDAGWYPTDREWWRGTGSWVPDPVRYPKGLKEVTDHAHRLGMKYVVWFEPERVTAGSLIAKEHPEWVLKAGAVNDSKWLFDLGNSDARKWLADYIATFITKQGIDLYRQDFNMDPLPLWLAADKPDRIGMTENLYVMGHLAFWDELRRRHPGMLIDTCASGGRRLDLETLRRSVPLLRTDYRFEPIGTQGQHYGISFWIPFSGSGLYQDTPYVMRSHMNSNFAYGVNFRTQQPDWALLKRMDAEWRKIAADGFLGDYYPLTEYSLEKDTWMAWQFNRPENGTGYVQAFRRPESRTGSMSLKLHGLEPKARYRLTDFDKKSSVVATGAQLMTKGLPVKLARQPDSAIVRYERR